MVLLIIVAILLIIGFLYYKNKQKPEEDNQEVALAKLPPEERRLFDLAMYPESATKTFIYALTTCTHCRKTKALLEENNVDFDMIYIDSYPKSLHSQLSEKMREYNPRGSFPTVFLTTGQIITGFRENSLKEALINDPERTS